MPRPLRVGLISLGCAKNLVDAEVMVGALLKGGFQLTNADANADVVLINTCSFIESAQQESIDAILECAATRDRFNPRQVLVVAGCLPQRFRQQLPELLPEVDLFMGTDQIEQAAELILKAATQRTADPPARPPARQRRGIPERVKPVAPLVAIAPRSKYILDASSPRYRLTPPHMAYIKIAEGCNHPCSFCSIPIIRGRFRSRPPQDIVAEAAALLEQGVRELNLISQDSTYYGRDLRTSSSQAGDTAKPVTLATLLRDLDALPGDYWVRLLYTHPAHWTDELMEVIANCAKVARYVDIPLQHIHPIMLERMRRETTSDYLLKLLCNIRKHIPGITLRTTFIVGFPGETEAHFNALLEFIQAVRFDRLGVFTYSREEGTRAGRMEAQVPEAIKRRRRDQAMAVQQKISRELCAAKVGRQIRVLVEGPAAEKQLQQADIRSWEHGWLRAGEKTDASFRGHYSVARSEADAPDIDGRVFIRGRLPYGEFALVKIIGHTDYDLIAVPVKGDQSTPTGKKTVHASG